MRLLNKVEAQHAQLCETQTRCTDGTPDPLCTSSLRSILNPHCASPELRARHAPLTPTRASRVSREPCPVLPL